MNKVIFTSRHGNSNNSSALRILVSLLTSRLFLHKNCIKLKVIKMKRKRKRIEQRVYFRTGIAFLSKRSSTRPLIILE